MPIFFYLLVLDSIYWWTLTCELFPSDICWLWKKKLMNINISCKQEKLVPPLLLATITEYVCIRTVKRKHILLLERLVCGVSRFMGKMKSCAQHNEWAWKFEINLTFYIHFECEVDYTTRNDGAKFFVVYSLYSHIYNFLTLLLDIHNNTLRLKNISHFDAYYVREYL